MKELVLAKYPSARVKRMGPLQYQIIRPRNDLDRPALVWYVMLSVVCHSEEAAWEDAAKLIAK